MNLPLKFSLSTSFIFRIDRLLLSIFTGNYIALNEAELEAGNQSSRPLTDMARIHSIQGNSEEALHWLQRAVDAGYVRVNDPAWMSLHQESRFQQIKAEADSRIAAMRSRVKELEKQWVR